MNFPRFSLASLVSTLRGLGAPRAAVLQEHEITTLRDLLWQLPFRYLDRGSLVELGSLGPQHCSMPGTVRPLVTIIGTIRQVKSIRTRFKFHILEIVLSDDTGTAKVMFYNQPYLAKSFKEGERVLIFGPLTQGKYGVEFRVPHYELLGASTDELFVQRILPVYRRLGPITSKIRSKLIHDALDAVHPPEDHLPPLLRRGLPDELQALRLLHQPPDDSDLEALNEGQSLAHQRLIAQELYSFSLGVASRKEKRLRRKGQAVVTSDQLREQLRSYLPFTLTPSQRRSFKEIADDLRSGKVMNRLLQGDVGSGKTLVAFLAMAMVAETGGQAALLVPTEVLARQHVATFRKLLGERSNALQVLLGGMKAAEKKEALLRIQSGEARYIIGTHAIFQEMVKFHALQLVVVDEQHRFGVRQREAMKEKGIDPHWLVMSATPIPRSLAMAIWGDHDHSTIEELPPGRQPVQSFFFNRNQAEQAWAGIDRQLMKGQQAYVVSPAIDPQDESKVVLRDIQTMELLLRKRFPKATIESVHGKMKSEDMTDRMKRFVSGETHILVATTVIEVGVDVPNATIMVVDHAERFGLSQLHQLRGRIGRGEHAGVFIMISDQESERLKALLALQDGFAIAKKDLELRQSGDFFGTKQSGLPTFIVADASRDVEILTECKRRAEVHVQEGLKAQERLWIRLEHKNFTLAEIS